MTALGTTLDIAAFLYALVFFPAPFFWLVIHPAIDIWRRQGTRAYWVAVPVWVGVDAWLVVFRHELFAQRVGRNVLTWILGATLLVVAFWLNRHVHRQFSLRRIIGLPELKPERGRGAVVRSGVYAHIRHPRYLVFMVSFTGLALLTGAAGIFALAIATVLMYLIVAPLEERELRDHYGGEYEAYAREVPRFIPGLRRRIKPPAPF
jgi:protein-S-isoprenylcysteine O-methyltransferase Ste14